MEPSADDDLLVLALNAAYHTADKHTASNRVHIKLGSRGTLSGLSAACHAEARQHPGIAPIVGCGAVSHRLWTATALAQGSTLFDVLAKGKLSPDETLELIHDVAVVLEHAHERGAIHRSLTTRSIVFRIAEPAYPVSISGWTDSLIDPGVNTRTIFTAPELGRGQPVDGRVDVYSLGVIALRALAGMTPAQGVRDVPGASPRLSRLIVQMLQEDPKRRPSSTVVRAEAAAQLVIPVDPDETLSDRPKYPGRKSAPRFDKPRWTPPMVEVRSGNLFSGEIDTSQNDTIRDKPRS